MGNKTNEKKKFPGFFECENHDRLMVLLENKPPTVCRKCHTRLKNNLTLWVALNMLEILRQENLVVQHGDMIEEILDRLKGIDKWIERIVDAKTKDKKEPS